MRTAARTLTATALATLALGAGLLAASAPAQAFYKPQHHHHHYGAGPIAAGVIGGLALGAIAASAQPSGACYYERRQVEDEDGNPYIRRVRVCE